MKPHLLLLHGALGSKEQFDSINGILQDKFHVHLFDFEGHGANHSSADFSMDLFATNAIAFLAENKIEKTHVFGYSMGGYVALKMTQSKPSCIQKIVTFGTKFDWTEESAAQEVRMLNPDKIEQKVPQFAAKLATIHSANDWKVVMNKTADMMMNLGKGARFTNSELEQIQHAVTIAIGSEDTMVSVGESQATADLLPQGNAVILNDFQHPLEKNDANELASFIITSLL